MIFFNSIASIKRYTDEGVIGTDLTYLPDDSILISNNNKLYKYKIRHNLIYRDADTNSVYFRELDSGVTLNP